MSPKCASCEGPADCICDGGKDHTPDCDRAKRFLLLPAEEVDKLLEFFSDGDDDGILVADWGEGEVETGAYGLSIGLREKVPGALLFFRHGRVTQVCRGVVRRE